MYLNMQTGAAILSHTEVLENGKFVEYSKSGFPTTLYHHII